MIISCSRSPFEFAAVRSFLVKIGYRCETQPEKLAFALLDPLDDASVEVRRSSHLTDSADRKTQLRFYSDYMVRQHLRTLAYAAAATCRELRSIEIHHCEYLSEGAALFFRLLDRHLPSCDVRLRFGGPPAERDDPGPSAAEHAVRILQQGEEPLTADGFETLFDAAHRCSYVGDYWSAERILERLEREREHREVNVLLGIAANATGRPFRAEHYYLKNYRGDHVIDKVRACYSLSMLCIRHHAPNFRDVARGEAYLQEAFGLLNEADPHDRDEDLSFRKVFNRNGYALVLYRRRRIHEALAHLDAGIARLMELHGAPVALHRSVLTYNKMLCHKALGDLESERACFHELIELDPLYPYYRLDHASSLMEQRCFEEAIAAAEQARALDPFLSESHSIMGKCFQQLQQYERAEESFRRACELDPLNPYHLCNLGILWNKLDKHDLTYDSLRNADIDAWDDANYEAAVCLRAESSVMVHATVDEALAILRRGLERRSGSASLRGNLELIASIGGAA